MEDSTFIYNEDNISMEEDCQPTVKATILKSVLMGSTYGLAAIILIIVIYWITTQVRQHLSSKKQTSGSQISHTYLDMMRPIQQGNADVRSAASGRILARTQEVAVGRVTVGTDSVLYETIPNETLGGPSRRTEGEQDTGEDTFGVNIHNPQPNWNTKATVDGAWNPRRNPHAHIQRQYELDEEEYLVPNLL